MLRRLLLLMLCYCCSALLVPLGCAAALEPGSVVSGLARPTSRPSDRVQAKPECVFGKLALESLEFVYSVRLVTNCSESLFLLFCKHRQTPGTILMQRRRGTASFQEL